MRKNTHVGWTVVEEEEGLKDMSEMERKKKRTLGTKLVFFLRRFLLRPTSDIASVRGRVEKGCFLIPRTNGPQKGRQMRRECCKKILGDKI